MTDQTLLALVDKAIQLQEPYRRVYDRAFRGEFGRVVKLDGRIYIVVSTDGGRGEARASGRR